MRIIGSGCVYTRGAKKRKPQEVAHARVYLSACVYFVFSWGADEGETRERERGRADEPSQVNCEWAAGSRENGFLEPFTPSAQVEIHAHTMICVL